LIEKSLIVPQRTKPCPVRVRDAPSTILRVGDQWPFIASPTPCIRQPYFLLLDILRPGMGGLGFTHPRLEHLHIGFNMFHAVLHAPNGTCHA
jgi:hypothetical protein